MEDRHRTRRAFATLLDSQKTQGTVVPQRSDAKVLASRDGRFSSRALFPFDGERKVEFYELRLAPRHVRSTTGRN